MRTTVRLDDALLAEAKRRALETDTTLTAVIESALREALHRKPDGSPLPRSEVPTFGGGGWQPRVDLDDSAALLDRMEGIDGARP